MDTNSKDVDFQKFKRGLFENTSMEYVNASYVTGTNWDFRMVFCEELSEMRIEPRVGVVMSHQQAKAFHAALGKTIHKAEDAIGRSIEFEPPKTRTPRATQAT